MADGERGPRGTLRVPTTSELSPHAIIQLLGGCRRRYPRMCIRLTLRDRFTAFAADAYDVGFFEGTSTSFGGSNNSLEVSFATQCSVAYASPAYLATREEPRSPHDLASHSCIVVAADHHRQVESSFVDTDGCSNPVRFEPSFVTNGPSLARLAAIEGMGMAVLPELLVADDFAKGTLKSAMPNYVADASQRKVLGICAADLPDKTGKVNEHTLEYAHCAHRASSPDENATSLGSPEVQHES